CRGKRPLPAKCTGPHNDRHGIAHAEKMAGVSPPAYRSHQRKTRSGYFLHKRARFIYCPDPPPEASRRHGAGRFKNTPKKDFSERSTTACQRITTGRKNQIGMYKPQRSLSLPPV